MAHDISIKHVVSVRHNETGRNDGGARGSLGASHSCVGGPSLREGLGGTSHIFHRK